MTRAPAGMGLLLSVWVGTGAALKCYQTVGLEGYLLFQSCD